MAEFSSSRRYTTWTEVSVTTLVIPWINIAIQLTWPHTCITAWMCESTILSHDIMWHHMTSHGIVWPLIFLVPELPISEGGCHIGLLSPEPSEPSAGGGTVSSGASMEDTATGGCFLPGQLNWCYSFSTHCTHVCMECYHTLVIALHVLTGQDLTTHRLHCNSSTLSLLQSFRLLGRAWKQSLTPW